MGLLVWPLLAASTAVAASMCQGYVGQTIAPVPIASVIDGLTAVERRGPYESKAEYQQRLAAANAAANPQPVIVDRPWLQGNATYEPDTGTMRLYSFNLGHGRLSYKPLLGPDFDAGQDSFGGIGFEVTQTVPPPTTYDATNGFGARFAVELTQEKIDALFEGPLKLGESPFVGKKRGMLAQIKLSPELARSIIEQGGSAFLVVPKAPFISHGAYNIAPSFSFPREIVKDVRVLWADVRCALIYDGAKRVVTAFDVK